MDKAEIFNEPMGLDDWGLKQPHVRSYEGQVLARLKNLPAGYQIETYGTIAYGPYTYPLYRVRIGNWQDKTRPTVLITGGVHGYEEAGIESALGFIETVAAEYTAHYNFLVYPCISPAAYEIDSRWNLNDEDPNRNFGVASTQQENSLFWDSLKDMDRRFLLSIDLHESFARDKEIMERQARKTAKITGTYKAPQWDEGSIPKEFFIYEDCPVVADRLGPAIIAAVEKIAPVCKWPTIGGDRNDGGVMYPEGTASGSDYAAPANAQDLPKCMDAFLRAVGITPQAFTTESYATGMELKQRIAVQLAVIRAALEGAMNRPAPAFTPLCIPA
jgi:hypothetical protein